MPVSLPETDKTIRTDRENTKIRQNLNDFFEFVTVGAGFSRKTHSGGRRYGLQDRERSTQMSVFSCVCTFGTNCTCVCMQGVRL